MNQYMPPTDLPPISVGVIGMGRVGPAIASALRASGHTIGSVSARSAQSQARADLMLPGVPIASAQEVAQENDLVFLAVPDGQIASCAQSLKWKPGQLVVHLSGALGLEALQAAADQGALVMALHPALPFTGTSLDVQRLQNCPFAVTASPLVLPIARAIVTSLGAVPFDVENDRRALYHAALNHAANHLVTILAQSKEMLEAAGVADTEQYLRPLCQAALDNALSGGIEALSGPVVRDDLETIRSHRRAMASFPKTLETYDALVAASTDAWQNRPRSAAQTGTQVQEDA